MKLKIALTAAVIGLAAIPQAKALPSTDLKLVLQDLASVDVVHCTPGRRHHIPTWRFRADGCRRPARKSARTKAKKSSN